MIVSHGPYPIHSQSALRSSAESVIGGITAFKLPGITFAGADAGAAQSPTNDNPSAAATAMVHALEEEVSS